MKFTKMAALAALAAEAQAAGTQGLADPQSIMAEALKRAIAHPEKHSAKAADEAAYNIAYMAKNMKTLLGLDKLQDPQYKGMACSACKVAMEPATILDNKSVMTGLEWLTKEICEAFHIEGGDPSVCKGAIDTMANYLLPALVNGPLSAQAVCDESMGVCSSPVIKELSVDAYVKQRLDSKPDAISNNDFLDKIYAKINADPSERKIRRSIQLSDLHIDPSYEEGMPTKCNFPICCRDNGPTQNKPKPGDSLSGYWGDYTCDIPLYTLENMFDFIAKNQDTLKTDFVTWVGDNSGHNVWDNTDAEITKDTLTITDMWKTATKDLDIDVFPIQGNHDTWPVNVQDFSAPNINYAINHYAEAWTATNWLSADEATEFAKWGYYSKPFRFSPKGRVIAVNMQTCNNMNWWLLDERKDPGHQLEWLEAELAKIDKDGGLAQIIAHIPPNECLHQFGLRYKSLMERYQHIVRFSSMGHTHDEDINVVKAINSTQPIGFTFITPSGTSGSNMNPSFAVIDFDEEYMVPVNTHTYILDLNEANALPKGQAPVWREQHDMIKEYNLKDMSPSSMLDLTERIYSDQETASQYAWNRIRRGGVDTARPVAKVNDAAQRCYL